MLVERFDAADKAYAIDQKNCDVISSSARRAEESVLPLQRLFSHFGHPDEQGLSWRK
jgi:hypothetical protein